MTPRDYIRQSTNKGRGRRKTPDTGGIWIFKPDIISFSRPKGIRLAISPDGSKVLHHEEWDEEPVTPEAERYIGRTTDKEAMVGSWAKAPGLPTRALMFHHSFAPALKQGYKRSTIRKAPKRAIKRGQRLSLRIWEGVAYRSTSIVLREELCDACRPCTIHPDGIAIIDGVTLGDTDIEELAKKEGFIAPRYMFDWFRKNHGNAHLEGVQIEWGSHWFIPEEQDTVIEPVADWP